MQPAKYEMFRNEHGFYFQAHCDCGSTMSCGEYMSSMSIAYLECLENMHEHQAKHARDARQRVDALIKDEREAIVVAQKALTGGDIKGAILAMGIPAHAVEVKS